MSTPYDGATVTIRQARPEDAAAGAALHRNCWREAYADLADPVLLQARLADVGRWITAWQEGLASGPPRLLAEADGELVGFGVAGPGREEAPQDTEVYALYVRQAWYGTGVAQALVDRMVGDRPAYLWVLEGNTRARAFYARNGFMPDGARETCEALGAWEIRMVRG